MSVAGFQAEMRISCVCAELLTKILKRCKNPGFLCHETP